MRSGALTYRRCSAGLIIRGYHPFHSLPLGGERVPVAAVIDEKRRGPRSARRLFSGRRRGGTGRGGANWNRATRIEWSRARPCGAAPFTSLIRRYGFVV